MNLYRGSCDVTNDPCFGTTKTCPLRPGKYPRANMSSHCWRSGDDEAARASTAGAGCAAAFGGFDDAHPEISSAVSRAVTRKDKVAPFYGSHYDSAHEESLLAGSLC